MKKKVLILTNYYVPGIKGGGPIQSIKNMVDNLSSHIDFFIVTSDRDFGDEKPYRNIKVDQWIKVSEANVFYTDVSKLSLSKLKAIFMSIEYEVIYLNSIFSFKFSILPILLKKFNKDINKPIVLAPRGEFSSGAMGLKNKKKKLYLIISKMFRFYVDITWHATTDLEAKQIKDIFNESTEIILANNLTASYQQMNYHKIEKKPGELKVVFISRIHPMKNLKKAIEFLDSLRGEVEFNIYGPIEDEFYWSQCKKEILRLPKNIKVSYHGPIAHDNVINIHRRHHVFLLPTLGENFGHAISEALIGGCPVIISDQTPWINLEEKKVGWDIRLIDEEKFIKVLQHCVSLGNKEYEKISFNTYEYGKKTSNNITDIHNTLNLFKL